MSILLRDNQAQRLQTLFMTKEILFHMDDLALLFHIQNKNSLRVTLNRYVQKGLLHRVQRGLYSLVPPGLIHPLVLGSALLHEYCYVSTETVLADEGIILQELPVHTFVSSQSRRFSFSDCHYISRQLHDRFLHCAAGLVQEGKTLRALPERAVADLLYFDPWYHFDGPVDWEKVRVLQELIGYPLTPHRYHADTKRS